MNLYSVINKVIEKSFSCIPSHLKGRIAERFSFVYLLVKGYKPLAMNDRSGVAELDLLMEKGDTIVVVEVKYRGTVEAGHYAISPNQKSRIEMQASLLQRQYPSKAVRIDGIFIYPHQPYFEHIQSLWS